jgi:CBS domain-containing protein
MPMTVKAILSQKGDNVITVEPICTLADAVRILSEHRIGALVIVGPDRNVAGILSERDIVRALAKRGPGALNEPVGEVMTRKVVTCAESETVAELMERMTQGRFRHVPVVERGRLVGLVSIGDIVKHRLQEMEHESNALKEYILTA